MEIPAEVRSFIFDTPRIPKIATIRKSGSPWVQPVWYTLDGDVPVMAITEKSVLGRTLMRDPRLALCFDQAEPHYAMAVLEGTVEISRDRDAARSATRDMVLRYVPETEDVEAFLDELLSGTGLLCRMEVQNFFFNSNLSE